MVRNTKYTNTITNTYKSAYINSSTNSPNELRSETGRGFLGKNVGWSASNEELVISLHDW